jgi:hypothetical protein
MYEYGGLTAEEVLGEGALDLSVRLSSFFVCSPFLLLLLVFLHGSGESDFVLRNSAAVCAIEGCIIRQNRTYFNLIYFEFFF